MNSKEISAWIDASQKNQTAMEFILDSIPAGVDIVDKDGVILFANKTLRNALKKKNLVGEKCYEMYSDLKCQCKACPLKKELKVGETKSLEVNKVLGDGTYQINHTTLLFRGEKAVLEVFTDITNQKKIEEEIAQKTAFIQAFQEITAVANEANSVREAMKIYLESVCKHTGWPVGHVYLPHKNSETKLIPSKIWYIKNKKRFKTFKEVTESTDFFIGEGLPGRVYKTKKPAWIINVNEDDNFPRAKLAKDIGVKGAFAFPITHKGKIVAVFEFFSEKEEDPDGLLLNSLEFLTAQIGRVVERKKSSELLVASEQKYRSLFENMRSGFALFKLVRDVKDDIVSCNFCEVNSAFERLTGMKREEVFGKTVKEVFPELGHCWGWCSDTKEEKESLRHSESYFQKTKKWLSINSYSHEQDYFTIIIDDVTEKKQLHDKMARLASGIESAGDAIIMTDINGIIDYVNPSFTKLTGYTSADVLGRKTSILRSGKHNLEFYRDLWNTILSGEIWTGEITNKRKNGDLFLAYNIISPLFDENKQITGFVSIQNDITERELAKKKLEQLALGIESAGEAMVMTNNQGVIEYVNPAFTKLTGYSSKEVIGQDPSLLKSNTHPQEFYRDIWKTILTGKVWSGEIINKKKNGELYNGYLTISPLFDVKKKVRGFVAIQKDVTAEKKVQQELNESKKRFQDIAESTSEWFWETDKNLRFTNISKRYFQVTKLKKSEVIGKTRKEIVEERGIDLPKNLKKHLKDLDKHTEFHNQVYSFTGGDDKKYWISTSGKPQFDSNGDFIGYRGAGVDVTEQEMAKELLHQSEAFLHQLFDKTNDGIWVIDKKKNTIRCNRAMAEFLGFKKEKDVAGHSIFEFVDEKGLKTFKERTKQSQGKGRAQIYEIELISKKGKRTPCLFSTSPFKNSKNEIIGSFAFVKDITQQRQFTQKLEEQYQFINSLLDTIPNAIFYKDRDGVYRGCNKAFLEFLGKKKEAVIGKNVFELYPQERAEKYDEMDKKLVADKKGIQVYETKAVQYDGSLRDIILYKTPYYNVNNEIMGLLGVLVDITDQKRIEEELKNSNEKLRGLDKVKDEFISIASHELRTPMTVINTYGSMLLESSFGKLNKKQRDFVTKILSNTNTLIKLVNDLLDISKLEVDKMQFNKEEVDLRTFSEDIIKDLRVVFDGKHISLLSHIPARKKLKVIADKDKLRQIYTNLIGNAFKFTPEGGCVSINVDANKDFVHVSIQDTGVGIPKEKLQHVFEKFEQAHTTLQRNYEGTGLGLAIVKNLVGKMGGETWVESEVNRGSTFHFTLPKAK